MESLEGAVRVLRHGNRHDLANLLLQASVTFDVSSTYGSLLFSMITTAEIHAPISDYDHLKALSKEDNDRILEAILEIWPPRAHDMEITGVTYRLDPESLDHTAENSEDLQGQLNRLRDIMISVSTGGPRINEINAEYKRHYSQLTKQLEEQRIQNPVPYPDLWDWYGKWSSGDLPTYQSRREYISGLFGPLTMHLRDDPPSRSTEVFPEATGWPRIDRTLGDVRTRLESAATEEQFQTVGLLCREVLISLAQTVFDPGRHSLLDDGKVSKTDAKRMLDRYLAVELAGGSHSVARKHAKASLDLANELQHERTAAFRKAALCAEATASVVNIIAILSGIRDPERDTAELRGYEDGGERHTRRTPGELEANV